MPSGPLLITIVYDNFSVDDQLTSAWGFSALVEYRQHTLLFDTGGDGTVLMENLRLLGIDPRRIEAVVLSHPHSDHTGGLNSLLDYGVRPVVYIPSSFPESFIKQVSDQTEVIEVSPGQMITEGVFTTGAMGQDIVEQALVIQAEEGLVIITGCAHPGIVSIVEKVQYLFSEPIDLVMGGFHLRGASQEDIDFIVSEFQRLKVGRVAPSHCTGEKAIASFVSQYGDNCLQAGVGKVIRINGGAR